jgi:hypothetical protein
MESSLVPADWAVPVAAKASPPPRAMRQVLARVSTLLTTVGRPGNPW